MSLRDDPAANSRAAVAAALNHAVANGKTVQEIARAIGKSRQMVGFYRAGTHSPSLETSVILARYLGISVDQLSGAEPRPETPPELVEMAEGLRALSALQTSSAASLQELARRADRLVNGHGTETGTG